MRKFFENLSRYLGLLRYYFTNRPPTPLVSQAKCQRGGCFSQTYNKLPTTYQEQVQILKNRGLIITDEDQAIRFLGQVHYYRLSAYFIPFQYPKNSAKKDIFRNQTTFENIINLYRFDFELKEFLFVYLGKLECSLRAKISYYHSLKFQSFGYLDRKNFKNVKSKSKKYKTLFDEVQGKIKQETHRASDEPYAEHMKKKYQTSTLPIWTMVETISFGTLSKLFKILHTEEKQKILSEYDVDVDTSVFENWVEQFSLLRNRVAHYSRVWNYIFKTKKGFDYPKKPVSYLDGSIDRQRVFFALSILAFVLKDSSIKAGFKALLAKYPTIPTKSMGIPHSWEALTPWSNL